MDHLNIRVTLPTTALTALEAHASDRHPLESLIALAVTRAGAIAPGARCLILAGDALDRVEQALGGVSGTITTGDALALRLEQQLAVSIGGVRVDFSKAELAEIKARAAKRGQTPETFIRAVVRALHDQFFTAPLADVPDPPNGTGGVVKPLQPGPSASAARLVSAASAPSSPAAPTTPAAAPTPAVATQTQPPTPRTMRGAPPRPGSAPQAQETR